ncbi:snoRNA-binding rRNA-processing protein [Elasticomyces elasticus]|nr:snoRNA-binding rRNA-processing protein [Elasticomyces elasticus]
MPKTARSNSVARQDRRHNPLSEEYAPTSLKQKSSKKRKQSQTDPTTQEGGYVDSKASRRILDLGQDLTAEDDAERLSKRPAPLPNSVFDGGFAAPRDVVSDDEGGVGIGGYDEEEAWGSEEEVEEVEVDPGDLEAFNRFNPSFDPATLLQPPQPDEADGDVEEGPPTNLADLILSKIAAHEAQSGPTPTPFVRGGGDMADAVELPAKVVEVYTQIGTLLSRYKSGRLPKPFKIIPTLPQWDTLLDITRPADWTPHAVYEATKLFTSSRPALAQAFVQDILLPRVREDIMENKKLNIHLYKALKKSLYKPAAFFRGLVFPLVASGTCTLREATIVGSVVARMMSDVESAGACNILIRTLLEKKYALPYRVVDALVFHFLRFKAVQQLQGNGGGDVDMGNSGGQQGAMKSGAGSALDHKFPVLWHQCLLAFAQRYKNEITEDQREALLDLLLVRGHKQIGPEVRRELLEGRGRGVMVEPEAGVGGGHGDDTMEM